jgi:hypothetical protein
MVWAVFARSRWYFGNVNIVRDASPIHNSSEEISEMVNMKRITAAGTALTILAGSVALPVNALASENGRRNTTIVLGSAALALLLAKRDKTAGIITALGAAYAYKRWNDDIAARHRAEQQYGYDAGYRYRQQVANRQHEAWLQRERWQQHQAWLRRQQELQHEQWQRHQEFLNHEREDQRQHSGWIRGGNDGYRVRQDGNQGRNHRDNWNGGNHRRGDH